MRQDSGGAFYLASELVRKYEGFRRVPYRCSAGVLTVGYGHAILPGEVDLLAGCSESEAEGLLLRDLAKALFAARDVGRVLNAGQAAALASLIFNIGVGAWAGSTIRRRVVAGDFAGAAAEFGRWNKAGGVVVSGLVARRADELRIFGGVYELAEK